MYGDYFRDARNLGLISVMKDKTRRLYRSTPLVNAFMNCTAERDQCYHEISLVKFAGLVIILISALLDTYTQLIFQAEASRSS